MIEPKRAKPTKAEGRKAREIVRGRSSGVCEGCNAAPTTEMHHRLYKSRGGHDTVSNFLHLCGGESGLPGGNHSGCHGIAHTAAGEGRGWSVRSGYDPAVVPVLFPDGSWWRLLEDGTKELVRAADAFQYMGLIQVRGQK